VALSAFALAGALSACSGDGGGDDPTVDNDAPIGDPAVPGGEAEPGDGGG
jgi:hypothetical protein